MNLNEHALPNMKHKQINKMNKKMSRASVTYGSGPQPFWHQGPVSWKTVFPQTRGRGGGGRVCSGGNASDGGDGSGGNASNGEQQMKLRSLTRHSPPAVRPGS